MAWTAPRDWVADEIVTAAVMNSAVRDNLRYLKGLAGAITFSDDIITAYNVDGVDVSAHESRHVSGGADDIDSALVIAAMANLTENKVWKGNGSNRPAEVDFPTKTLNPANENVLAGYYAATTLSAVDADLAVGNIRGGVTIFGFLGTIAQAEDITGSAGPINAATSSGPTGIYHYRGDVAAGADEDGATKTQAYDASSIAVATGFFLGTPDTGDNNKLKLRLYMGGVQVTESAFINAPYDVYIVVGTRALSGATICKVAIHNYDGAEASFKFLAQTSGNLPGGFGIGIGSIKL